MISLVFHIRCLLLLSIFVQSVSLYKIYAYDQHQPEPFDSSFKDEVNPSLQYQNIDDEGLINDDNKEDDSEAWETKLKRSLSSTALQRSVPQRRNNRPHWNPLVAAYKRCGELVSRVERESCFKEAVQMLFVYKLRK